ncbi:MAG: alpha/beta hydrolase [Clostridium sp.]|uniref:alpha/beta hydrolase n=1 Tax=Clostridium sp. DSM 8431 TaxID=1761781 RepID=UPI0008E01667|nr:alpha/beta hydrolase [Clostridium sp. DSM 8431]MCR4944154.1 alpha/beta hydrolase [Clostridium sp.]SFU83829.1 Acetyl esterase/lipase [Clostridium sp. DSM 8431]
MNSLKDEGRMRIKNPERTGGSYMLPDKFKKEYTVREKFVDGYRMETIYKGNITKEHIYFLHGGAYVLEACPGHKDFVEKLADMGFTITYIDYPLAPESTAEKTIDVVIKGYNKIIQEYSDSNFYLLGDSAGGGLAVSLAIIIRDEKMKIAPKKSVLISPWLDISLSNKEVLEYDKIDPALPLDECFNAGVKYRGNIDEKDPRVSPIYGDLNNLGEFFIIYTDSEILNPDCRLFKDKIEKISGSTVKTFVETETVHDYIILEGKEKSEKALKMIEDFLKDK